MEKLNIKHIAPYLPYNLRMYDETLKEIFILNDIKIFPKWTTCGHGHIDVFKPILRPMDGLYKHLEDGIIPIVELATIARNTICWSLLGEKAFSNSNGYNYSFNYEDGLFSLDLEDDLYGESAFIEQPNQIELFQKLFEWHFDVFDLHKMGLAIYENEFL